jgi:hypothetical protein
VVLLKGPRGVGKSRLVREAFSATEEARKTYRVHTGGAVPNGMGSQTEGQTCAPFEPLRKAIGKLVGVNRFLSAAEQWRVLKSASDLAEDITGLSVILGLGIAANNDDVCRHVGIGWSRRVLSEL